MAAFSVQAQAARRPRVIYRRHKTVAYALVRGRGGLQRDLNPTDGRGLQRGGSGYLMLVTE